MYLRLLRVGDSRVRGLSGKLRTSNGRRYHWGNYDRKSGQQPFVQTFFRAIELGHQPEITELAVSGSWSSG
jgi:hypothetical protein